MMNNCLVCTKPVNSDEQFYHQKCAAYLFDDNDVPVLDISANDITALAKASVKAKITVPGVQQKISLEVNRELPHAPRLTIVAFKGKFILKPDSNLYRELPQNEHCSMLIAQSVGIKVVPFGLIRMKSGQYCYITRRIDRDKKGIKYPMEDMCQLTERLTEDKYKGSHEQVGKVLKKHCENVMFDVIRYFDQVFFSFLCGNADMHLKNFSLIREKNAYWTLSPAYDMVSTRLVISEKHDPEELAVPLCGKKKKFTKRHFQEFGHALGLTNRQIENRFSNFYQKYSDINAIIENSFLSPDLKEKYSEIIEARFQRIFG